MNQSALRIAFALATLVIMVRYAYSDGVGNILNTKHNFSAVTIRGYAPQAGAHAVSVAEVCVFCHTPHGAIVNQPLWNHSLSSRSSYIWYSAATLLSKPPASGKPDGDSLLCLSCHDGDQSVGAIHVYAGKASTEPVAMTGTSLDSSGKISSGLATNFGSDLSGHHPISIEMSECLVSNKNTECTSTPPPPNVTWMLKGISSIGKAYKRKTSNQYTPPGGSFTCAVTDHPGTGVQCSSCHDAHLDSAKFLRTGSSGSWSSTIYSDSLCCECHVKCSDGACP